MLRTLPLFLAPFCFLLVHLTYGFLLSENFPAEAGA